MRWGQDWGAHPGCPEVGLEEITTNLLEARLWITSCLPTIRELMGSVNTVAFIAGNPLTSPEHPIRAECTSTSSGWVR